jgi:hypothetical protein
MVGGIHHVDHQLQRSEYKGAEYIPVKSSFDQASKAIDRPVTHSFGSSARRGRFSGTGSIFHHINELVAREAGMQEERKNGKMRVTEKQAAKKEKLLHLRIQLLEKAVRVCCLCVVDAHCICVHSLPSH